MKKFALLAVIALLLAGPFGSSALAAPAEGNSNGTKGAAMAVDALAARPLGLASTVFGAATFVISLPFSALGDNIGPAYESLIVAPAKYTFDRPLGEFD